MITGESKTVTKGPGRTSSREQLPVAEAFESASTAVGEQTALSGIMRLVAAAQASGSRSQALADRAAALLFYVAVASGRPHSSTGGLQETKNTHSSGRQLFSSSLARTPWDSRFHS